MHNYKTHGTFIKTCARITEQALGWHKDHSASWGINPKLYIDLPFQSFSVEKFILPLEKFIRWQLTNSSIEGLDNPGNIDFTVTEDEGEDVPIDEKLAPRTFPYTDLHLGPQGRRKLAIMYGAGIDSTIALYYALDALYYNPENIMLIQVDYGAPYAAKENAVLDSLLPRFKELGVPCSRVALVPDLQDLDTKGMPLGYIVPFRNSLLASIGAKFAENVWIVANYRKVDDEPGAAVDKNRRFYGEFSRILSELYTTPKRVESPFLHWSKAQTIEWMLENYDREEATEILKATTTCYSGEHFRCGTCYACAKLCLSLEKVSSTLLDQFVDQFHTLPWETDMFIEFLDRERAKGRPIPARWQRI